MVDKDSEPDDESNKNDYQTNKVFNSGEQKPKSILWNFLGIIGGLLGYWLSSILIAAVLAFVAIYIACGGEFGIKW